MNTIMYDTFRTESCKSYSSDTIREFLNTRMPLCRRKMDSCSVVQKALGGPQLCDIGECPCYDQMINTTILCLAQEDLT